MAGRHRAVPARTRPGLTEGADVSLSHPDLDPDHPMLDAFDLLVAVDRDQGRVVACRTDGLTDLGFPELLVLHDPDDDPTAENPGELDPFDQAHDLEVHSLHVVRTAQMMTLLALDVLAAGTLDVMPRQEELLGLPVRFWLGEPQLVELEMGTDPVFRDITVPVHWVID
jgi:hypothetical protein